MSETIVKTGFIARLMNSMTSSEVDEFMEVMEAKKVPLFINNQGTLIYSDVNFYNPRWRNEIYSCIFGTIMPHGTKKEFKKLLKDNAVAYVKGKIIAYRETYYTGSDSAVAEMTLECFQHAHPIDLTT